MFGIKLVGAPHFDWPFLRREGKPPLMNFPNSSAGRRTAAAIPIGHQSLVYIMHPVQRLKASIEYVKWDPASDDVLEEGARAAAQQGAVALMEAHSPWFARVWRCIRVLAWIDDERMAPTPDFGFHEGEIMRDIPQQEYSELFNAIPWSWTSGVGNRPGH
jgi:hypothetical protein